MNMHEKSKKPDEFFVLTHYVSRRMAYPIALLAARLGVSANTVTILGGSAWVASAVTVVAGAQFLRLGLTGAGWSCLVATAVLWNVGYILDVADGSLARMTDSASSAGFYLDFVFHLIYGPMFLASIGVALYLVSSQFLYIVLAVLATCANWGVSFSAKEHVLCDDIAKGRVSPHRFPTTRRYDIYIDSPRTRQPVADKPRHWKAAFNLVQEIMGFPGQFSFFGFLLLVDFALLKVSSLTLPTLMILYPLVTVAMLLRVPFRIRREFRTMKLYDETVKNLGQ